MTGHSAAQDGGPDYRVTLANERTFLAWIRTALAAAAASVAVSYLARDADPLARRSLAVLLALSALGASVWSVRRWQAVERATWEARPITARTAPWVVAVIAALLAAATVMVALSAP